MNSCRVGSVALLMAGLSGWPISAQPGNPAEAVTVPMLSVGGRPVIEVSINDSGPHRMMLDTGASRTVVSPEWMGGATGPARLKSLRIGGLALQDVDVSSQVLFGGTLPPEFPRGVMSALAFPGYLVTLDYVNKTVVFRKGVLPQPDARRVFGYSADDPLPKVPVVVAGHNYAIHVDSGSPGGVMLPVRASKEVPLAAELTLSGRARTNAGEFEVFTAPAKGPITLGEYTLEVPLVRFSDLSPGGGPGPGNIGYEVLRTFKVTIDSANRRVAFER